MVGIKTHMLNGWVNTSSGAAPPVTAFQRLISVYTHTRHLEVRA